MAISITQADIIAARDGYARLTPSERKIARLMAVGESRKDIATVLGIAVKTVDVHVGRLREKLGYVLSSQVPIIVLMAEGVVGEFTFLEDGK